LRSPFKGQPTTEALTGDQQTAEDPTTSLQAGKAPKDPPALESLPSVQSTAEGSTTDLPEGEIPKELTESSSQGQSTAERSYEDHAVESLPIIKPATETLPSSGKLSGKTPFHSLPRIL
jgi:hypothetical protein